MSDRTDYDAFLATSRQRTIFAESWWLDTTAGVDGWSPNVLRAGDGAVRAAWPAPTRTTSRGALSVTAPYTPFLGPQLPDRAAGVARVSADVELLEALAALLGAAAHVESASPPELDYWTPLSWHGFAQTTRTTWRITHSTDMNALRAGMRKGTRNALSAAERDGLVVDLGTVEELLAACAATFAQQDIDNVPARDVLERVARTALERGRGHILAVRAADGALAAAGLFVWDDRWTWNLANGRIADSGATGAPTILLWHAICAAMKRRTGFDFEGSMLQPVERFVRGFGGEPHGYSVVRRSSPAWVRVVARKRLIKRLTRLAR